MITDIPCVILSGGKSSRMGEDKSLLPFGDFDTMIEYQYDKLSKLFNNIYISSKADKFDFLSSEQKETIIIYDNTQDISSPMVALDSIFDALDNYKKIFIITVDIPLVEFSTIRMLIKESKGFDITIAKDSDKTHNLCGVFGKGVTNSIKRSIDEDIHKINYLIKNSDKVNEVFFNDKIQFTNINTQENYSQALKNIENSYIDRYIK